MTMDVQTLYLGPQYLERRCLGVDGTEELNRLAEALRIGKEEVKYQLWGIG